MTKKYTLFGSAIAALILAGCGGSNDTTGASTGYLIDSAVYNADYDCVNDNEWNKTTGTDGAFSCQDMRKVRFRIGEIVLGEISGLPADGKVLPQDIVGVLRGDTNDSRVIAMAQLLQTLDEDANLSNGIQVSDTLKEQVSEGIETVDTALQELEGSEHYRTQEEAREHLRDTLHTLQGGGHRQNGGSIMDTPLSTLTQELKDAIAYMGNEERLAYDIYLALYDSHADAQETLSSLERIATRSESRHIETVQSIVRKYGLTEANLTNVSNPAADSSTEVSELPSGQYDIDAIQSLYDALYAKGVQSAQDALEVACMVEVTDINDLNHYITLAQDSDAPDVESAFTSLRDASYKHYWAFDRSLKAAGIAEGCCTLGTIDGVNYCHDEYPQNSQGGGNGNGNGGGGGHGNRGR